MEKKFDIVSWILVAVTAAYLGFSTIRVGLTGAWGLFLIAAVLAWLFIVSIVNLWKVIR